MSATEPRALELEAARAGGGAAFENRLRKNLTHLRKWARREGVTCLRAYDADLPEYAVAVDLYAGRWAVVQEYAAPRHIDPAKAAHRLAQVVALVPAATGVAPTDVHLKVRERGWGGARYGKQAELGAEHEVTEGPARLLCNFTDRLDTGLFLDHRLVRGWVRERAAGKRFLNLFCYTATATVHAALGGARSTTSVDLSATYLAWAGRNLALNGIGVGAYHRLVQADCMEWLREASGTWDLILLDPPAFSNSKRMDGTLDVQRDHAELVTGCMRLLAPDGLLIFSNNLRGFSLDARLARFRIEDRSRASIPPDFARHPDIHRCYFISHP